MATEHDGLIEVRLTGGRFGGQTVRIPAEFNAIGITERGKPDDIALPLTHEYIFDESASEIGLCFKYHRAFRVDPTAQRNADLFFFGEHTAMMEMETA